MDMQGGWPSLGPVRTKKSVRKPGTCKVQHKRELGSVFGLSVSILFATGRVRVWGLVWFWVVFFVLFTTWMDAFLLLIQ